MNMTPKMRDRLNVMSRKLHAAASKREARSFIRQYLRDDVQQLPDVLAHREALARDVYECATPFGNVHLYSWGIDCDHSESDHVSLVPAVPFLIERKRQRMFDNAEGPCAMYPLTVRQVAVYEPTRRDHVLEAHEDGHPWNVGA